MAGEERKQVNKETDLARRGGKKITMKSLLSNTSKHRDVSRDEILPGEGIYCACQEWTPIDFRYIWWKEGKEVRKKKNRDREIKFGRRICGENAAISGRVFQQSQLEFFLEAERNGSQFI